MAGYPGGVDRESPLKEQPQEEVRQSDEEVTQAMNRVCAKVGSTKDEFANAAALRILRRVEW